MATKWTAYSEDMRLGQGFNSYVQETRVNDAVLITKIPRVKTVEKSIAADVHPLPDLVTRKASSHGSEDSEKTLIADGTQEVPKSRWGISTSHELINAADQMHKNGMLDQSALATLAELVSPAAAPVKNASEEKPTPTANSTINSSPSEEDIEHGLYGLLAWPKRGIANTQKKRKEQKIQRKVGSIKETKAQFAPRSFPCNLTPAENARNQRVTFSSREVKDQKDIQKILGISASASVKSGNIGGDVGGSYDCEADLKAADMTFVVHVRVTNEPPDYEETLEFQKIEEMTASLKAATSKSSKANVEFTKIYGDCFIFDFITGGELFAIIHITSHDKQNTNKIRLHASAQLSPPSCPVNVGAEAQNSSESSILFTESEISINLIWRGGGEVKIPHVNWDIPTLMRVANAFPNLVSRSHAKIGAILMPYTSLRSYQQWRLTAGLEDLRVDYSQCGPFAEVLLSEYCDYKGIADELDAIALAPEDYRVASLEGNEKHGNQTNHDPGTKADGDHDTKANDEHGIQEDDFQSPLFFRQSTSLSMYASQHDNHVGYQRSEATTKFLPFAADPILLDPESIRAARRFCVRAMSKIQQRVQQIAIDPSSPEHFGNYPCPGFIRSRLPCHKYSDGIVYNDPDPMLPAEIAVSRSLFCEYKQGDELSKHRKYEHAAIGNVTVREPRRDIYEIRIHPYKHRAWLSRSKISKSYHNAIAGITFVYCDQADPANTFSTKMRIPTKLHTVGKGDPGPLPKPGDTQPDRSIDKELSKDSIKPIPPKKERPLDIKKLDIFWEKGAGCIAGLTFYDGEGVQERKISHLQWGGENDPMPESMIRVSYDFEDQGSQAFAGLVGSFEAMPGWGANRVLSRCAVIYGYPDGSNKRA